MQKQDLRSSADIVNNNIKNNIEKITSVVYKYDVKKLMEQIKTLSKKDKDIVLEICINDCLTEIQKYSLNENQIRKLGHDTDEIMDFYQEDGLEEIMEEASEVAFDLIMKLINHNGRKLPLPIEIEYLKTYCIHNLVKEKDIQTTLLFILLELSSVCYCLKHNNYNEVGK